MIRWNCMWILLSILNWKYCLSRGKSELCFIVVGDIGGLPRPPYHTPNQLRLANLLSKVVSRKKCKFIVGVGDNIYFNGVENVYDPRFRLTFEKVYAYPSLNIPWYMIGGNHDHLQNISAQIAYTKLSDKWNYPDYYYSKEYRIPGTTKRVELVMIDTTMLCWHNPKSGAPHSDVQLKWIKKKLMESRADYLIVAGHHPIYSAGSHGSTPCLNNKLKPLLNQYNITAYFSGHDHNLQHIKESDSGVHYFVSGSGNFRDPRMPNIKSLPKSSLKFQHGIYGGFVLVVLNKDYMKSMVVNSEPSKLYSININPRFTDTDIKDNYEKEKMKTSNAIVSSMPHLASVILNNPSNPKVAAIFDDKENDPSKIFESFFTASELFNSFNQKKNPG